jgi:hypothetical protein
MSVVLQGNVNMRTLLIIAIFGLVVQVHAHDS